MGYQELIDSLKKEGEKKAQAIREETRAEADRITSETEGKIKQLREEFRKKETDLIMKQENDVFSSAETRSRSIRLSVEESLSARLFELAGSMLHELRDERYTAVFASLVKELPSSAWTEALVNQDDVSMTLVHFPGIHIIGDNRISGGIDVSAENSRQRIINTFEKRLERAWEEMHTFLIHEVRKEASAHEISA
jgi:vacuolar-type H+-ATPase subunit E/Vma4